MPESPPPPKPLTRDQYGTPPTDAGVRNYAEAMDISEAEARAQLERIHQCMVDEYNRERLQEWRDAYGPDPDDEEDDDE